MFLADLHLHSTFSQGELSIPELVDLFGSRGFGAIAITDRLCESESFLGRAALYMNRTLTPALFPLYMDILRTETERAWKEYQMVLIPGLEITQNILNTQTSPKFLALGVSKFIQAKGEISQLSKAIRAQGGLAIAGRSQQLFFDRHKLAREFDAWEISAGHSLSSQVLESTLPVLAGSGFYKSKKLNSWKTVFFCERNRESIFGAIRKQELCFKYFFEERQGSSYGDYNRVGVGDTFASDDRSASLRHLVVPDALSRLIAQGPRPFETIRAGFDFEAHERRGQWD